MSSLSESVQQSLTMMSVAIPTMFIVIVVFYGATKALHRLFPAKPEPEGEQEEQGG